MTDLWDSAMTAMVEDSPDGMLLADGDGSIVYANARIESMFGVARRDLLGRPVESLLPERHRQVHVGHRGRYQNEPKVRAMGSGLDLIATRADGSEFPVEVSLSPVDDGDRLLVVATVRDITERVALEANTHAVLHTIDAAHDAVLMFTPCDLRFDYVNRGAVQQLGYTSDELSTMSPTDIQPELDEPGFRKVIEPLVAGAVDSIRYTTVHRRADGRRLPVEISLVYPPAAGPDRPRLLVAVARDITDRIRSEKEIREQQSQLQVMEDRERLAQDLHDVVIQRIFAAGMGLQAILNRVDDPQVAERIDQTVIQLDETITELRNRIFYLNRRREETTGAQIDEVVTRAARSLGHEPELIVSGDPDRIPPAVRNQLLPVLTEALSNVARHAAATETTVELIVDGDEVALRVADDGVGLPVNPIHGGGLSNLLARAQQLGGTTSIAGRPDGGTVLTWTAPLDGNGSGSGT
ncbi:MAG: PAS domain S-box protein [Acidimicrobiales bacterium]